MEWRVETPNNAEALKKTLDEVTSEGWTVEYVVSGGSGTMPTRRFTVIASRAG